jgi:peroxiredoxin
MNICGLPKYEVPGFPGSGMTLLKRFTLGIEDGIVKHVFYPVFPNDQSASEVVAWLSGGNGGSRVG